MGNLFGVLKIFLLFNIFFGIVNSIIYYQIKNIDPTLKNLASYNGILLLVYWVANILVTKTFSYGENLLAHDIWKVNLIYWGTGLFSSVIFTYLWLGKLPTGNNLIGLIFVLAGVVIANLPK